MEKNVISAIGTCKSFHVPITVKILSEMSFSIQAGEFVSIVGKSGCGLSTLLFALSTTDTSYDGELFLNSVTMKKKDAELALVRNEKISAVF